MADNFRTISDLDISFKEFMPGQVIQSTQFNDDMRDIEEKVNEVIGEHNKVSTTVVEHLNDVNNPHQVTAHQVGTYTVDEIDELIEEIKDGHLYDNAITNRVLGDGCVDNRTLKDKTITAVKVEDGFGNQIDISENIEITDRYTKSEVDELVRSKVGEGAYTREEIDQKFQEFQAGQIIDKTISADKVTSDFGDKIDISNNTSITNRYTKGEVDRLISMNGLPKDWGYITDEPTNDVSVLGTLPVAGHMVAGQFKSPATSVLNIDVKENVEARGEYNSVKERLDNVDSQIKDIKNLINNEDYFILKSPNGTQYKVKVTDTGNLEIVNINTEGLTDLLEGRLLVWHDEFEDAELNLKKWRYATHNSGGSEQQAYTFGRSQNVRIENNTLILEALKDSYIDGYTWSSGRIDTCGLGGFKYGRIEAKLKYDVVSGAFPAFWTIGTCAYYPTGENVHGIQYSKGTQWAQNGELDVFEGRGTNTTISQGGWYNQDDGKGNMSMEFGHKTDVDASEYHIYAIEWTETTITSYIDGVKTGTKDISGITSWHRPHYLILNMAVGSTGGTPADDCTSMKMYVDWVRVYAPASITQKIDVSGITLDTNRLLFNLGDNPQDVYYTVTPSTAWDNNVNYETSDTHVAEVYGSRVYPRGVGECNLIAKATNGVTTQIPITVGQNIDIPSTSITITNTDVSFYSGTTYQINTIALPSNHTDTIKYSSNNDSIATVDSDTGLVTGVAGGNCTIRAYSSLNDAIYDEIQITVIQKTLLTGIPTDGLTLQLDRNGMSSTSWTNAIDNIEMAWKVAYNNSTDISSYMVYDGESFYWAGSNYLDHLTLDGFSNYYDFGESQTIILAGDFTNASNPILSNQSDISSTVSVAKLNFNNMEYKDSSNARLGILSFNPSLKINGSIAVRYNKDTLKANVDRMAFTDTGLTSSTATLTSAFTQGSNPALLGNPATSKIYYKVVLVYNRVLTDEEVQTAMTAIKTFLNS